MVGLRTNARAVTVEARLTRSNAAAPLQCRATLGNAAAPAAPRWDGTVVLARPPVNFSLAQPTPWRRVQPHPIQPPFCRCRLARKAASRRAHCR